MAVLTADLDRVRHLAEDQAVAVAVLREMAVGALHALLGMDVHHMNRLAELLTDRREIGHAGLAEFLRIVGRDDLAIRVEQIAGAVALVDRAEIPAMAVIIGELGVLGLQIDVVIDPAEERDIAPFSDRRRRLPGCVR